MEPPGAPLTASETPPAAQSRGSARWKAQTRRSLARCFPGNPKHPAWICLALRLQLTGALFLDSSANYRLFCWTFLKPILWSQDWRPLEFFSYPLMRDFWACLANLLRELITPKMTFITLVARLGLTVLQCSQTSRSPPLACR